MSRRRSKLLRVELEVKVYDGKGKLMAEGRKEGDLILDNFKWMLSQLLRAYEEIAVGVAREVALVALGGTSFSVPIWANRTIGVGYGLNFTGCHLDPDWPIGVRIRVGTSTVSPTRGDYKLGSEVAYGTPTITVGADYISWAVSITLETAADIAEAGMSSFYQTSSGAATDVREFLLLRDTFTPISVPAGGTISVTYKLTL